MMALESFVHSKETVSASAPYPKVSGSASIPTEEVLAMVSPTSQMKSLFTITPWREPVGGDAQRA
jgi:hypothetical protein